MVHPIFRVPSAPLPPRTRVLRLYRGALRRINDRYPDRAVQLNNSFYVRREFEQHRHEKNAIRIAELLDEAEERFRYMNAWPDKYLVPTEKKGTSFQRNTPLPRYMLDPRRYIDFDHLEEGMEALEDMERANREQQLGYKTHNPFGGHAATHSDHANAHGHGDKVH